VWFQKIFIPTLRGVIIIFKGEGVSKAKYCKGKYEPNLKFQEGLRGMGGFNPKNPLWDGYR